MKHQKVQEFMTLLDNFKNSLIDNQNNMDEAPRLLEKVQNFFIVNNKLLEDTEKIEEFVEAYNNFVDFKNRLNENDFKYKSKEELFEPLNKLVDAINIYIKYNSEDFSTKKKKMNNKVFIVHGHDKALENEVARFVEKLGLEVIILHEQASSGKTIIEKIEHYSDVSFGIVLYTPCDIGGKTKETLYPRARQNVIFEHGYLIGKIGRENVVALVKDDIEKPSDISGIIYIDVSGDWRLELAKEMKAVGYDIDLNDAI